MHRELPRLGLLAPAHGGRLTYDTFLSLFPSEPSQPTPLLFPPSTHTHLFFRRLANDDGLPMFTEIGQKLFNTDYRAEFDGQWWVFRDNQSVHRATIGSGYGVRAENYRTEPQLPCKRAFNSPVGDIMGLYSQLAFCSSVIAAFDANITSTTKFFWHQDLEPLALCRPSPPYHPRARPRHPRHSGHHHLPHLFGVGRTARKAHDEPGGDGEAEAVGAAEETPVVETV